MKTQLITLTMAVTLSTYAALLLADDDDDSKGTSPDIAAVNNSPAAQPMQPLMANVEVAEVKGQIVAIFSNLITIKVSKVEHFQLNGNIVQADVQNAQFKHGTSANLHLNALVEVKGRWDGNRLFASHVDFEDKGRSDSNLSAGEVEFEGRYGKHLSAAGVVKLEQEDRFSEDTAKVKGKVLVINQNLVIVTAGKTEGFEPGINMVATDIQNAQFEDGYRADLRLNAVVEIEGRWDGKHLYASEVKFEDDAED